MQWCIILSKTTIMKIVFTCLMPLLKTIELGISKKCKDQGVELFKHQCLLQLTLECIIIPKAPMFSYNQHPCAPKLFFETQCIIQINKTGSFILVVHQCFYTKNKNQCCEFKKKTGTLLFSFFGVLTKNYNQMHLFNI